jgi:two-component system copper resistance phosphate regulon response regulator CusR
MKVLVVEDEVKVRNFIQQALTGAGMVVDAVSTRSELLAALKTCPYDLLIMDRMVKGNDLVDSIPEIRKSSADLKILVLSALTEVEEKVKGLTEGADDYLGKPFHLSELIARIRTLTRREGQKGKDTLVSYQDLKIDLETQRVLRGTKRIDLTAKEYRLLCLLIRHPGRIFSRMDLLDQVWDMNHYPESNVVEVTVASLRSKLDKEFKTPLIQSRRGAGYWLGEP